jgi:hypothetical protein
LIPIDHVEISRQHHDSNRLGEGGYISANAKFPKRTELHLPTTRNIK